MSKQTMRTEGTVLVIGATGFLGSSLVPYLERQGHRVIPSSRHPGPEGVVGLDARSPTAIAALVRDLGVSSIVNVAAATNVDQCESDVRLAFEANAAVPWAISRAVADSDPRPYLVHLSTDQVYEGVGDHTEESVAPINVYGLSKLTGELFLDRCDRAVLRTNFFGRSRASGRSSLSDWVVRSLRSGEKITLFEDVKFNGLHVSTLCTMIERLIETRTQGTFNFGSRGKISKAAFALELARVLGLSTEGAAVGRLSERVLPARRPLDMSMCVKGIEQALNIECPDVYEEIRRTAEEYLDDEGR